MKSKTEIRTKSPRNGAKNQDNTAAEIAARTTDAMVADYRTVAACQGNERQDVFNSPRTTAQKQKFAEAVGTDVPEQKTNLPDPLRSGLEALSGQDLSDVQVHYDSGKPAAVGALAYARGNEIHIAPGQEKHLPHEGWHVVQQMQGRVIPTFSFDGLSINNDQHLEKEADVMGDKAMRLDPANQESSALRHPGPMPQLVTQCTIGARAGSDKKLKGIYDALVMRSLLLRALGHTVGNKKEVKLTFAPDEEMQGRSAAYLPDKHQILIHEKYKEADEAEIKKWVLIELNHAREIVHTQEDNTKIKLPEKVSKTDNDALFLALEALRVEYHEWISAYLTYVEIDDVNQYTSTSKAKTKEEKQKDEINPLFKGAYDEEGSGWYIFDNYLDMQRGTHTTAYDPKAKDDDWVGEALLNLAQQLLGEEQFIIENVVELMDVSDLPGYKDSHIILTTKFHDLLRRENPFKGSAAQKLVDAYS
jgi:hypothetical protein